MGIARLAGLTWREAIRRRTLIAAVVFGAGFLTLYGFGLYMIAVDSSIRGLPKHAVARHLVLNSLLVMGLYAVNWLVILTTVMVSLSALAGEISSGAMQSVVSKPLARWRVVAGKWTGYAAMLTGYLLIMAGGLVVETWLITGHRAAHIFPVLALMWLESLLLLSLTFCMGARLSTLTTGVVVIGLHMLAFMGGFVEEFGQLAGSSLAANLGIASSLLMPSEALWRRAAAEIQGPMIGGIGRTPFGAGSVPSNWMIAYAALYATIALGLAVRRFARRDL
jgi:ABC-type transport system involved in multi-copper enzyme maturation permease subunit